MKCFLNVYHQKMYFYDEMAKELLCVHVNIFFCQPPVSPFIYVLVNGVHYNVLLSLAFTHEEGICRHQPTLTANHLDIKYSVWHAGYKSIA